MSYSIVLLNVLLAFIGVASPLTYPIVDTGVTQCSSNTEIIECPNKPSPFYGQDAQFSGNQPSYQDNGNNTVTDLVTGLMWTKEMWKYKLEEAEAAVASLDIGGYTDWRIPTIKELYSLVLFTGDVAGGTSAGTNRFIDTNYFDQPLGDVDAGEREIDAQTISSNEYTGEVMGGSTCSFGMNYVDGRLKCYPVRRVAKYFRFVRGVTTYGQNTFVDRGDGTVKDRATGLMWQQGDSVTAMDWENALVYCKNLEVGGYLNWRLPDPKELQSIVDYNRSPQHTGTPAIDPIFHTTQIENPDGSDNYPYYWTSTTFNQAVNSFYAIYISFGEAVGAPYGECIDVHGAGAQRSDPKTEIGSNTYPRYHGPQMDLQRVYNFARCVRG